MNLLQRLRDEAHEFANAVHRETRDYAHFYEMANLAPSLTEPERQELLQHFGSSKRVAEASVAELRSVIGSERGEILAKDINVYRSGSGPRIKPLVVPTRFQDENGAVEDLRPISSSSGRARRIR